MKIIGNMIGTYSSLGKTFVLVDENNNELTAVAVENITLFTAKDDDVRKGKVYASDNGVSVGTHEC